MLKLIYTICSESLMNEDFHAIFLQITRNLSSVKKQNVFVKKKKVLGSKNAGTCKYPENFLKTAMLGTSVHRGLKLTSIFSNKKNQVTVIQ